MINFLDVSDISSNYIIKDKSIYFNENKFKSNTLFNFEFDIIIDNILKIYHFLQYNDSKNIKILNNLVFRYLYSKYIELKIKFVLYISFRNLLTINNIFPLFLRKLLFILLKRFNLFKIYFIKNFFNLNIKDSIK